MISFILLFKPETYRPLLFTLNFTAPKKTKILS